MLPEKLSFYFKKNRTFLKQLVISYGIFFANIAVMLWQTPFLLNHLGKELYGCWILSSTILSYMSLFSFGYMNTFVADFIKGHPKGFKYLVSNAFLVMTITFFISIPFFFLVYYFSDRIFIVSALAGQKFKTALLISFITHITGFYYGFFITIVYWVKKGIQVKNFIELFILVFTNIGYYLIIGRANGSLEHLIILNAITSIITLSIVIISAGKLASISFKYFNLKYLSLKFKTSFNFFLLNLSNVLIFLGDNLMVSIIMGVKNLPAYSLSFRISDYSIKIIKKIIEIKAPELAHLVKDNKISSFISLYKKIIVLGSLLSLTASVMIVFFGEKLLVFWLGNEFQFNKHVLIIFSAYIFFSTTLHVNWNILAILAKHKNLSYFVLIESGLNIGLSIILYNWSGVVGFAYATLLSTIICSWWYSFYKVNKEIKVLKNSLLITS